MDTPLFTDDEYINGSLLNSAFSEVQGDFATIGSSLHTAGLLSPASLVFTPSNLVLQIQAAAPFMVLFGNGLTVGAHGTVNGADTSTYSLNMASFVPGSGSQLVYILAQYTTIGEQQSLIIGPPQGHPDYDPAFAPFEFYTVQRDSMNILASTTPANNSTTFELARITLNAGQTIITLGQIVVTSQVYASAVLNPTGVVPGTYAGTTVTVGIDGRITGISAVPYGPLAASNTWTGATNAYTGNVTVNGITFFGTSTNFYANPNSGGNQVFNFAPSQYIQFTPGTGFVWNTTGTTAIAASTVNITAPAGTNVSNTLSAGGKVRAATGAYLSNDPNAAAILNDFLLSTNGVISLYQRFPSGLVIQASTIVNSTGIDVITFPDPFATACFQVIACEGAPGGGWVTGNPTLFGAQNLNPDGFTLYVMFWNGSAWAFRGGITTRYIAIGI